MIHETNKDEYTHTQTNKTRKVYNINRNLKNSNWSAGHERGKHTKRKSINQSIFDSEQDLYYYEYS